VGGVIRRDFPIEKNIPMPSRRKYPFNVMEIGDSVLIPNAGSAAEFSNCLAQLRPKRFTTHKERDEHGNYLGVRVWRIA